MLQRLPCRNFVGSRTGSGSGSGSDTCVGSGLETFMIHAAASRSAVQQI